MPSIEPAARRYALAAFELAQEERSMEAWADALEAIAAFMSEADIKAMLENTRVGQEAKLKLIDAGLNGLPPLALNLARLLVHKGRTSLAPAIAAVYGELLEAEKGIAQARAMTEVILTDEERALLEERLKERTGKQIVLQTEVDESLLCGVLIQIGDQLIDASTRSRLRALRESMVGAV